MEATNLRLNVRDAGTQFQQASAQTKLVILQYLAKQLHRASSSTTPSAFFSQKVHEVLRHVQQIPREERSEALHEVLMGMPTRLTEAYQTLDTNMKMAFWYRLATHRRDGALLPTVVPQDLNRQQASLLNDLASRDSNELVALLHEAVDNTAIAPT